jgi:hypothetical protein
MAAPKGHKAYSGGGRPKGSVEKSTINAREALARFVDANTERLQGWLEEIYKTDGPKAAWECMVDVIEYHVPKLQRTELTGEDGTPFVINLQSFDDGRNTNPKKLDTA